MVWGRPALDHISIRLLGYNERKNFISSGSTRHAFIGTMNEKSLMGIGRGASTVTSQHPRILEQCFEHVGSPLKMGSGSMPAYVAAQGPQRLKTRTLHAQGHLNGEDT
jgi:hypothetical protein